MEVVAKHEGPCKLAARVCFYVEEHKNKRFITVTQTPVHNKSTVELNELVSIWYCFQFGTNMNKTSIHIFKMC